MANYIDKAALVGEVLTSGENQLRFRQMTGEEAYFEVLKMVCDMPVADVELVRHGKWLDMQEDDSTEGMWRCSVCGEDRYFYEGHPIEYEFKFCPVCGARMDGGADNGE